MTDLRKNDLVLKILGSLHRKNFNSGEEGVKNAMAQKQFARQKVPTKFQDCIKSEKLC